MLISPAKGKSGVGCRLFKPAEFMRGCINFVAFLCVFVGGCEREKKLKFLRWQPCESVNQSLVKRKEDDGKDAGAQFFWRRQVCRE